MRRGKLEGGKRKPWVQEYLHHRTVWAAVGASLLALSCAVEEDLRPGQAAFRSTPLEDGGVDAGPSTGSHPFLGGDGSDASPYIIETCEALQAMREHLGAHYRLGDDVDCTNFGSPWDTDDDNDTDEDDHSDEDRHVDERRDGHGVGTRRSGWFPTGFEPIGSHHHPFHGSLDGGGFRILNLNIRRPQASRVGLFGVTYGAKIYDLGLVNIDVKGRDGVGKLIGKASATRIEGVFADGTVSGRAYVGGLVGWMQSWSRLKNSYQLGDVHCRDRCGLLVGKLWSSEVKNAYAVGQLLGCEGPQLVGVEYLSWWKRHKHHKSQVKESFFDCDVAGRCRRRDRQAKRTEKLQDLNFLKGRGWNFDEVWGSGLNTPDYACLRWEESCRPFPPPTGGDDVTCDGIDDDGDGSFDEDYVAQATSCGVGACAASGETSCVEGEVQDSCAPGTPAATDSVCDGLDEDCDGTTDEDFEATPTTCGFGACSATGQNTCVAGTVEDSCMPGTGAPSDTTCDGVDDDCDGAVDDDHVPASTNCGIGACTASGASQCVAGTVEDSCVPGTPAPSDASCNGIDEDCDGTADEDFVGTPTTCGSGACVATGLTLCVAGAVVDSCTPGAGAATDATCDGVDDDCDGAIDDDYVGVATSCGSGACTGTGVTVCTAGVETDTCTAPDATSLFDIQCDGIDEDCDGEIDEDFLAQVVGCGEGACAATGMSTCSAEGLGDDCTPGAPLSSSDATCDGVDDDCDGLVDEDFLSTPSSCGVGACAAAGTQSCVSGVLVDSCRAVTATFSDTTCDGIDDDCNGIVDDDCCEPVTCGDLGQSCGFATDGCGTLLNCGGCTPQVCGSDGQCRPGVGVIVGPDLTTVWGKTIAFGSNRRVTQVQGENFGPQVDCVWDFGDGTIVSRPNCQFPGILEAPHSYAAPGNYTVTLTATAGTAVDADSLNVTVNPRPTVLVLESVASAGSEQALTVRLFDEGDASTDLSGRTVSVDAGGTSDSGPTDGSGRFTTTRTLDAGDALVGANFGGDTLYAASALSETITVSTEGSPKIPVLPPSGHEGRRFMIGFPQNTRNLDVESGFGTATDLYVHLSTAVAQVVTVSAPGVGFQVEVPLLPNVGRRVDLPIELRMGIANDSRAEGYSESGLIQELGVELTGTAPFAVHAMDQIRESTDGYLGIPTEQLGTEYIVLAYPNEKLRSFQASGGSQIGIVATEDGTTVSITPSRDVSAGPDLPTGIAEGTTADVLLDKGQTLLLANQGDTSRRVDWEDLSGTHITSSAPISVFAGHACTPVTREACDHLVEQMPPVSAWGRRFFLAPLAGKRDGDVFRFVASQDRTEVRLDGDVLTTLDTSETYFLEIPSDRYAVLESSAPILLAQHAKGQGSFGFANPGDPFMALVPPAEQYPSRYRLLTPERPRLDEDDSDYTHYFNLIVRADKTSGVQVNGTPFFGRWYSFGGSGWAGAQLPVRGGAYSIDHAEGNVPIGVLSYGFEQFDSYGFPAGWNLGARACEETTMTPGDGADNDCDGRSDEERANGEDDDGDGLIDEDLQREVPETNLPPTAESFSVFAPISPAAANGEPLSITTIALRGQDPNDDALTFELVTPPTVGTAEVRGRTLIYTAERNGVFVPPSTYRGGPDPLVVRAFDGELFSAEATVTVDVGTDFPFDTPPPCSGPDCGNLFPVIVTNRTFFVTIEEGASTAELVDQIEAYDANRDPLTFTLTSGPPGLTLDSNTGDLRWTVGLADVGTHPFSLEVTDGRGGIDFFSRTIQVTRVGDNARPVIVSTPVTATSNASSYVYDVDAIDPEGQPITYSLDAGPPELSIDSLSGILSGTVEDFGRYQVTVRATDALGASSTQSYELFVVGVGPLIVTSPVFLATEGVRYGYAPQATHPNASETLTWSLTTFPPGMTIDAATGRIDWTPQASDVGFAGVRVEVRDEAGLLDAQSYTIDVRSGNLAPSITSIAPTRGQVEGLYLYDVEASDPEEADILRYSLSVAPAGMLIDPPSGVIQWIPDAAGSFPTEVTVTDLAGNQARQAFVIEVRPDDFAPRITLTADPVRFAPGGSSTLQVAVNGPFDPATVQLTIAGAAVPLAADLSATFSESTPGVYLAVATAQDDSGNTGTATVPLSVENAADNEGPTVSLTSPADDETVTYLHDVVGSVQDDNLAYFQVTLRRTNETTVQTIAEGYSAVSDGTLGTLDATLLENGWYELGLYAEDVNGLSAETSHRVRVDGEAKLGVVKLSFVDLAIEMAGIPLTVIRSYDSRIKQERDFGFGWTLELKRGSIQHNRPVGDGFAIYTGQDDFEFPCQRTFEQLNHFTEVRLSKEEFYIFRPMIVNAEGISGGCVGDVAFVLVDGTFDGAELTSFEGSRVRSSVNPPTSDPANLNPSQLTDFFTGELYDPQRFQLTTGDGRVYDLSIQDGLTRASVGGHDLLISRDAIQHSDGRQILIERDSNGRIERVRDPAGNTVSYQYDRAGDLVGVVDVLGGYTGHEYSSRIPHHLTSIIGANGLRVAALEYDSDGRMTGNCDAEEACSEVSYDLVGQQMDFMDPTRRPAVYRYDTRGNVASITDAMGNTTRYTHDARDHLTSITDPLGNTTTYVNDAAGFPLEKVRPLGSDEDPEDFTTRFSWYFGNLASISLPSGGTVEQERDVFGNELSTKVSGVTVYQAQYLNPRSPTLVRETSRFGTIQSRPSRFSDRPEVEFDERGRRFDSAYNDNGDLIATLDSEGLSRFSYDALGRPVTSDFGRGNTIELSYDGDVADWTRFESPDGAVVTRRFSQTGRLAGWSSTDGDTVAFAYDGAGRLISESDERGVLGTRAYDLVGRLEAVTDVRRGAITRFSYDAAGRVTTQTDALGVDMALTYEPDGRIASVTNGLGNTWRTEYAPTEQRDIDPLGRVTITRLDSFGRAVATTRADGVTSEVSYLGLSPMDEGSELPVMATDGAGREREFSYTPFGELASATDLARNSWSYTYPDDDTETFTSPSGESWRVERDGAGEPTRIVHPDGGELLQTLTLGGEVDVRTLPTGETVDFDYNSIGALARRSASSGESADFTYNGQRLLSETQDEAGTTTYQYDEAGRLTRLQAPSRAAVAYEWDALDRVVAIVVAGPNGGVERRTEYSYDAVGSLVEVRDPLGGATQFEYDEVGRRTRRLLPNGVETTYAYDLADRVIAVTHRNGAGEVIDAMTYQRSPTGEPTRIDRADGSRVELDYDVALRIVAERWFDADGSVASQVTYGYDTDGNRTSKTEEGLQTDYRYETGFQLREVSNDAGDMVEAYGYDANGRVTEVSRDGVSSSLRYNTRDDVTSVTRGVDAWAYEYDAMDRRVAVQRGGAQLRYLVAPSKPEGLESPHLVTDDLGDEVAAYVYAGEQPLLRYEGTSAVYYLEDAMGSVAALVDNAGSTVGRFKYDSFGNVLAQSGGASELGTTEGDFRFQGMWLDTTGFYYARARTYDPTSGRFVSRDPVEGDKFRPETLHPYVFANSNPQLFSDPTGLYSLSEINFGLNLSRVMKSARANAARIAKEQIKDQLYDAVGDLVVKSLEQFLVASGVPSSGLLSTAAGFAAGNQFESWLTGSICSSLGNFDAGTTDYVWLQVPVGNSGRPGRDGISCGERNAGVSPSFAGINTRLNSIPDIVFSSRPPTQLERNGTPRSLTIAEAKLGSGGIRRRRNQFNRIVAHARNYSYSHTAVWITFRKARERDVLKVQQAAADKQVYVKVVSVL